MLGAQERVLVPLGRARRRREGVESVRLYLVLGAQISVYTGCICALVLACGSWRVDDLIGGELL